MTREKSKAGSEKARLGFQCDGTQPQTLLLTAGDFETEMENTAAEDRWQEIEIPAAKLLNGVTQRPMPSWRGIPGLHIKPKVGADSTKVLFSQFKWVLRD